MSSGTSITVGAPDLKVALELSGQIDKLPFKVKWANISGGPQCSEAFRANALDICSAAEIPSINAHLTGLDTKLVASKFHKDPFQYPICQLGIAPGAGIKELADLRGKEIAYSPGQAQGALVLRILKKAGLTQQDVQLVELEPQLLLADEPFGALDPLTRIRMHTLLRQLRERHRPAALLVTHDVDETIALADRVVVLEEGRIAADFPVELPAPRRHGSTDAVFFADGPALPDNVRHVSRFRLEPFTWPSAIAAATERIGLIATGVPRRGDGAAGQVGGRGAGHRCPAAAAAAGHALLTRRSGT